MAKLIDLTGQKIDKLLILEKAPSRKHHVYWKCKCDCGAICEISGESLRKKQSHNCGVCELKQTKQKQQQKNKKNYLVGKKFGKLTVLQNTGLSNNQGIIWNCVCDCGKYKQVSTQCLTSGHTKSCGCLKLESHLIDITGKKFGKLTALYFIPNSGKWHCKCDCGKECDVNSYGIKKGLVQSCGCINYSIGEQEILKLLEENNILFKKEYSNPSLKSNNDYGYFRFDFGIFDNNNKLIRLIEFDGEQHFNIKNKWRKHETFEERQKKDKRKNEWALEHNIPLIRIPYWERGKITLDMLLGDQYLINK